MKRYNHTRGRAFTLIELLIVIAIISVLLTILVPALQQAKEQARKALCTTNLHHIITGLRIYSLDGNNDKLPLNTSGWWLWDVSYFTTDLIIKAGGDRDTFYCPSNPTMDAEDTHYWFYSQSVDPGTPYSEVQESSDRINNFRVTGYFWLMDMNTPRPDTEVILGEPKRHWLRDMAIPFPEDIEIVTDSTLQDNNTKSFTDVHGGAWTQWGLTHQSSHLHGETPSGGNIAFVDGHVGWRDFDKMQIRFQRPPINHWW
ncbi:MAG: type II secretion system protein [Sedimentisphaerales bacterium]|nr:type II secretion system protein [Sedimentisphaerales bacterium]